MKIMLDKEYLYKESSAIIVNGIKKDVVKYSLKIDSNYYKKISNAYYTFVKDDSKLLNIMSVICDKDMNEILNYLYSNLITKDKNVNLIFDIYMVNGNEFVGTDVTINGFRSFYYYKYDENMEFYLNLSDYIDGVIKDKFKNMIFLIKGTNNGDKTNLLFNYNGKMFGIEYDGKRYHQDPKTLSADESKMKIFNEKQNIFFIRVREKGCLEFSNSIDPAKVIEVDGWFLGLSQEKYLKCLTQIGQIVTDNPNYVIPENTIEQLTALAKSSKAG
jgi:hypothetical protein